jgi:hypothetical protein
LPFCHTRLKAARPSSPAYPRKLATWGDHIRKRTLDLNLLQREIAERPGVDEASVWTLESNRYVILQTERVMLFPR